MKVLFSLKCLKKILKNDQFTTNYSDYKNYDLIMFIWLKSYQVSEEVF